MCFRLWNYIATINIQNKSNIFQYAFTQIDLVTINQRKSASKKIQKLLYKSISV